eukprot:g6434.t1
MEFDEECRVLSMHQPWASLLVHGIKRIENRNWRTNYRGKLWIHATSRNSVVQEVQELEDLYKFIFQMEGYQHLPLPETYPTSALLGKQAKHLMNSYRLDLGCVTIVDCLTASEVENWKGLPDSLKLEIGGAFCFLCEDPLILQTPERMRGYPGLWKLHRDLSRRMERILRTPTLIDTSIRWTDFT